jgi:hypothetical protein
MRRIVLDEFHITVFVTRELPDKDCLRIRRTLKGGSFRRQLDRALLQVLRRYPSLRQLRAVISQ